VLVTAQHSLQMLKLFTIETLELGICDVSRKMGLSKSTISRIVSTFVEESILEKNRKTGRYRLSPVLLELGLIAEETSPLIQHARGAIDELSKRIQREVSLCLRDNQESICVYLSQNGKESISGQRTFLPVTLSGLVTLVFSHDNPSAFLRTKCPARLDSSLLAKLLWHVGAIDSEGYAQGEEPLEMERFTVACPIFHTRGYAIGAVSMSSNGSPGQAEVTGIEMLGRLAQHLSAELASGCIHEEFCDWSTDTDIASLCD